MTIVTATNQTNSPFSLVDAAGKMVHFGVGKSVTGDFIGPDLAYLEFLEAALATGTVREDTIPTNTVEPTITGVAQVGVELTGSDGTWTGEPVPTLTRRWLADGEEIDGATRSTYTPVEGDVGALISFMVTGTNVAGSDIGVSDETAAVIAAE